MTDPVATELEIFQGDDGFYWWKANDEYGDAVDVSIKGYEDRDHAEMNGKKCHPDILTVAYGN